MKKLFTSFMMLLAAVSMSAQDTSSWEKGQDVSDQLEWQLYDGTADDPTVWVRTLQKEGVNAGHFYDESKSSSGCWEMYNAPVGMGTYQIFPLPAGIFRFQVQGFHRNPSNQVSGPINAEFFLDVLKNYNPDDSIPTIEIERSFSEPLMRICQPYNVTPLLNNDGDWQNDYSQNFADGTWYVPNSMWGAALHFEQGQYSDNSITVAVTDGAYVRLGIRMTGAVGNDWVIWSNFRAFYQGMDANLALLQIAKDKLDTEKAKAEALKEKIIVEYGSLGEIFADALYDIDDETDATSVEGCEEAAEKYVAIVAEYQGYYADAVALAKLVAQCAKLDDDAEFTAIVNEAKAIAEDTEQAIVTEPTAYKAAYSKLYDARIVYTNSHPDERGAYNYSSMINMPFFCDNDFTPTWDAEANAYIFADVDVDGEMFSIEDTWCTEQEKGYTDKKNENPTWVPICENYSLSSEPADGVWCMKSTTWHGGGPAAVTMQHGYPAVGGWTAEPSGNPELLYQTITNLPNGYYSMSALMCNAGAELSPLQYAYIETTDGQKEICNLTQKGNPWWGGNRDQWRQTVWQKLETSMVYVSDGRVTIGTSSDAFYASTGFQLYYYGETPDFLKLLADDIKKVKESVNDLILSGDSAMVCEMINSFPTSISTQEEYVATRELINKAYKYSTEAAAFSITWDAANSTIAPLSDKFEVGTVEFEILDKAFWYASDYPRSKNATYLGEQAIDKAITGYEKYIDARAKMVPLNDAELNAILAKQAAALTEEFASYEKIEEYLSELAAPYNKAYLASVGADKASEANPVDVTALIENADFENGTKGWNGDFAVNWGNGESWNTSSFKITQTIYNLPKGTYRVEAQAFYRDGGDANAAFTNYWYNGTWNKEEAEAQEIEMTDNAKLIANGNSVSIASIASEEFTETAMPGRYDYNQVDQTATDIWLDEHFGMDDYDENHKEYVWIDAFDEEGNYNTNHPFDNVVLDAEDYYYPNSQEGASKRFAASPNSYHNAVEVYLSETSNLELGVAKYKAIANDWCIFDNFKLFYLGAEPTTAINSNAVNTTAAGIYSVNGIRKSALSSGINIVKMSNGAVKKIIVK